MPMNSNNEPIDGKFLFNKIFGQHSDKFFSHLVLCTPGCSENTRYEFYKQFYAREDLLSLKTRLLITIASLVTQAQLNELPKFILGALNVGNSIVEVSETILQMGIYIGDIKANSAMTILCDVIKEAGIDLQNEYSKLYKDEKDLATGDQIFRRLFGDKKAEEVYKILVTLSLQLPEFAIERPFGQFYAKEHLLDLQSRELITIASLVTSRMLPQLNLHIGAAYNIGCTLEQIEQVILQMSAHAGNPAMLNAMKEFSAVKKNFSSNS